MRHSGVVDYNSLLDLYSCAERYLGASDGLLALALKAHVFPSELFTDYDKLANYFGVFSDSPYAIRPAQLQSAIQVHLMNKYTYKLEEQFVAHLRSFYDAALRAPSNLLKKETVEFIQAAPQAERQASLSRQRLYSGDSLSTRLDVPFAWFFLSIVGLLHRCETVTYVANKPISGNDALTSD